MLLLLACTPYESGADEAFRVRDGTFEAGELPEDPTAASPTILYAASTGFVITQGQGNIGYSGLSSADTWSIAVSFPDVSTGYWVIPAGAPDVTQDNNLLFGLTIDFGRDVPYGLTSIAFSAIDEDGHPGPRHDAQLCVLPDFADGNFAACDPDTPPQDTILSLSWDTDADLDLVVVTPAGKVVRANTPSTAIDEDDESSIGVFTRDSNANCVIDAIRLESLVFEEAPPAGDYLVYASLFSACGEPVVDYSVDLYRALDGGDGTWSITHDALAAGVLLPDQADGGSTLGTYVTTVTFP